MFRLPYLLISLSLITPQFCFADFWRLEGQLMRGSKGFVFVINPGLRITKSFTLQASESKVAEEMNSLESGTFVNACIEGDVIHKKIIRLDPLFPSKAPMAVESLDDFKVSSCRG